MTLLAHWLEAKGITEPTLDDILKAQEEIDEVEDEYEE